MGQTQNSEPPQQSAFDWLSLSTRTSIFPDPTCTARRVNHPKYQPITCSTFCFCFGADPSDPSDPHPIPTPPPRPPSFRGPGWHETSPRCYPAPCCRPWLASARATWVHAGLHARKRTVTPKLQPPAKEWLTQFGRQSLGKEKGANNSPPIIF